MVQNPYRSRIVLVMAALSVIVLVAASIWASGLVNDAASPATTGTGAATTGKTDLGMRVPSPDNAAPALAVPYQREWAVYQFSDPDEELGQIEVSLEWRQEAVVVDVDVTLDNRTLYRDLPAETQSPARSYRYSAQLDPQTGRMVQADLPDHHYDSGSAFIRLGSADPTTVFPWGWDAWLPHGLDTAQAFQPEWVHNMHREFVPLGLQWVLLAHGPGEHTWGDLDVYAMQEGNKWIVGSSMLCWQECVYNWNGEDSEIWASMGGSGAGILPKDMAWGYVGEYEHRLMRVDHHVSGEIVDDVDWQVPDSSPPAPELGLCGGAPCEPLGWPTALSLQAGFASLQASPEFLAWAPPGTDVVPVWLFIVRLSVADVPDPAATTGDILRWHMTYVRTDTQEQRSFTLTSAEVVGQQAPPPAYTSAQPPHEYWYLHYSPASTDQSLRGMEVAVDWVESLGLQVADIRQVVYRMLPDALSPDPEGRHILELKLAEEAPWSKVIGSLVSGEIHSLTASAESG